MLPRPPVIVVLFAVCAALLPSGALAGPWGPRVRGAGGARALLARRGSANITGTITDRSTGDFSAFMFTEVDRIFGELQNHTAVFTRIQGILAAPMLGPIVNQLPSAYHRADFLISAITASLLTSLRGNLTDAAEIEALSALYQDAMRVHMAYGQGAALEAMGYQAPQINAASKLGLDAAKNNWAVLGVSGFELLDYKAWAAEANREWTQLVGFATSYSGTLTSAVLRSQSPFSRLMASSLPAWAKLDAVINFERDTWAARAALLAGKDAASHAKMVMHAYWRWDAYFQAVLLDDAVASTASLIKAFDALTMV